MVPSSPRPTRRVIAWILVGVVIGLSAAGVFALWEAHRSAQLLATIDFRTHGPEVPDNVLDSVRGAEERAYADMGIPRRLAEDVQDALALLSPRLAFARDYSLGPYRIKASTVSETLDYALDKGYLTVRRQPSGEYRDVLPQFALQPSINDWEASVLLDMLKNRHPQLSRMSWAQIAADPNAIAKLYSGYMGAGGDWPAWAADDIPGPVARQRLGYDPATGGYAAVAPAS